MNRLTKNLRTKVRGIMHVTANTCICYLHGIHPSRSISLWIRQRKWRMNIVIGWRNTRATRGASTSKGGGGKQWMRMWSFRLTFAFYSVTDASVSEAPHKANASCRSTHPFTPPLKLGLHFLPKMVHQANHTMAVTCKTMEETTSSTVYCSKPQAPQREGRRESDWRKTERDRQRAREGEIHSSGSTQTRCVSGVHVRLARTCQYRVHSRA